MTTPASTKPKTTFDIELQRYDLSAKRVTVTVHKLPRIIVWDGHYFKKVGKDWYEQVSGEDLSNITETNSDRISAHQLKAST